ncbi:hypothetical protein PR048_011992 [Dryococelus australis]|uniref:Uncharacterized protein n=1 Tax=Dryococelus australis TaxID=614101 RepID=A0ABQ9HN84_9NEOP|nr:hypothetical protein PR048_011992 [Dryococelus australis]
MPLFQTKEVLIPSRAVFAANCLSCRLKKRVHSPSPAGPVWEEVRRSSHPKLDEHLHTLHLGGYLLSLALGSCQSIATSLLWQEPAAATAVVTGPVHFVTAASKTMNVAVLCSERRENACPLPPTSFINVHDLRPPTYLTALFPLIDLVRPWDINCSPIPEKTCRPAASSGTILTYENTGVTQMGVFSGISHSPHPCIPSLLHMHLASLLLDLKTSMSELPNSLHGLIENKAYDVYEHYGVQRIYGSGISGHMTRLDQAQINLILALDYVSLGYDTAHCRNNPTNVDPIP